MVLKRDTVEVPLYVGMGEGQDAQSRSNSAVVSENVRFDKKGAIRTREPVKSKTLGYAAGDSRVVPDIDNLLIAGPGRLYQIENEAIADQNPFEVGREIDTFRVPLVLEGCAWVRAAPQGDNFLVAWQTPDDENGKYEVYCALLDGSFRPLTEPSLVENITQPGVDIFRISDTICHIVAMRGTDLSHTLVATAGNSVVVSTPLHTTVGGSDLQKMSSVLKGTDIFTLTTDGPLSSFLVEYDANTSSLTANTDLFAISARFNVEPYGALALDASNDVWAVTEGFNPNGTSVSIVDPVPVGAPASIATSGEYTGTSPSAVQIPVTVGSVRGRADSDHAFFVGTDLIHVHASEDAGFACVVVKKFDTVGGTLTWEKFIPQANLLGEGWSDSDGIHIPLVFSDSWLIEHTDANGTISYMDIGNPLDTADSDLLSPPLYTVGAIATLNEDVESQFYVHSFFGQDEVTNHSNVDGGNADVIRAGTSLDINGTRHFFHARQVEARTNSGDSVGAVGAIRTLEGYGCSLHVSSLGQKRKVDTSVGAGQSVVANDLIGSVQGNKVTPTTFPIPPRFVVYDSTALIGGGGPTTFNRNYRACYAKVNEDGSRSRGPMSHTVSALFHQWNFADTEEFYIPPFPRVPGLENVVLEVYAEQMEGGVPQGTLQLAWTFPLSWGQDLPTKRDIILVEDTEPNPIDYTFGGELPNEAQTSNGDIVYAGGRVWVIDNERAFFSKTAGFKRTLAFNKNLYVDSPDGTPFTGVAAMDEQVILFTFDGVYQVRGRGVNDLGTGAGFTVAALSSPTGCVAGGSVLSFEGGVLFQGQRGIHLLRRNLTVDYIGAAVEDSLSSDIDFAYYDRVAKEAVFAAGADTFVLDIRSGNWTKCDFNEGNFDHIASTSNRVIGINQNELLIPGEVTAPDDLLTTANLRPPMRHSTPWLELSTKQGYQRCREFLIQGKAILGQRFTPAVYSGQTLVTPSSLGPETATTLTAKIYVDDESEPAEVRQWDLRNFILDPLELRLPNPRQKCRSVRIELSTEAANIDLTITSIVALIGRKQGAEKRQNSAGT